MGGHMADWILRGGTVVDGTGGPRRRADVAIAGDRIAEIGNVAKTNGAREVDISGLVVAPGFIDVHTHDDRALLASDMTAKASQGVTTVITGNCGVSLAPLSLKQAPPPPLDLIGDANDYAYPKFADYLDALDRSPPAINAAALVGHSTLRAGTMTELDRPARADEIARMQQRLAEALGAGAIGMSTGLYYAPAAHAPSEEVEALAKLLGAAGAIYTTHMRDEAEHVLDSLDESFHVGETAEVPVVISHHKTTGVKNFGRTVETLPKIAAAMQKQPLGLDAYPYVASSTVLRTERLEDATRVLITWSKAMPDKAGRDLGDIAKEWGVSLREAAQRLQPAGAIYWMMDEADVRRVLAFEHTMIGSDGLPHDAHPHPRLWGTFPRVLGHYCREVGLFALETAVRKMTGLPASRFGLSGRGVVAEGAYADLTVFDAGTIIDRATFAEPMQPAAGIAHVFVNGRKVWSEGKHTGERSGRALRRQHLQAEAR